LASRNSQSRQRQRAPPTEAILQGRRRGRPAWIQTRDGSS